MDETDDLNALEALAAAIERLELALHTQKQRSSVSPSSKAIEEKHARLRSVVELTISDLDAVIGEYRRG